MSDPAVADVRRFNRTVTEHVGALDDRFLGLDRPLGQARLLWEIGRDGSELRALRARLGLDSGYLTRLVQSLERAGLVTVAPSPADRRTRVAQLTRAGRAEWHTLEERSDAVAQALLDPLTETQRDELVSAMRQVERLLTAGAVQLREADPTHPDAQRCIDAYFAELDRRSDPGAGPARDASLVVAPDAMRPPAGALLVAYLRDSAIGCGAVKHPGGEFAEIKRLWVAPEARGLGVGRRLLTELEARAGAHGARAVRLDTNRNLTEAIAMYRRSGYVEVEPFNDEPFAHHWFEKGLG